MANDIVETATEAGSFSTLLTAVEAAGLEHPADLRREQIPTCQSIASASHPIRIVEVR